MTSAHKIHSLKQLPRPSTDEFGVRSTEHNLWPKPDQTDAQSSVPIGQNREKTLKMKVPILFISVELVLAIGIITFIQNFASKLLVTLLSDSQFFLFFLLHHVGLTDDGCLMERHEPESTLSKAAAGITRDIHKKSDKKFCMCDQ